MCSSDLVLDLNENSLVVDISDALSERDKVKFTVHSKVSAATILLNLCGWKVRSLICFLNPFM